MNRSKEEGAIPNIFPISCFQSSIEKDGDNCVKMTSNHHFPPTFTLLSPERSTSRSSSTGSTPDCVTIIHCFPSPRSCRS